MRKFIGTLAGALLLVLLGLLGLNLLKGTGPRERVSAPDGSKIIVEEMSYYIHGSKTFGRLLKPADGNGDFPDSLGPLPTILYFHEPLKTDYPESVIKGLVSHGVIGYVCGFRGKSTDAVSIIKRIRKEKFADPDRIFVICDSSCCNEVLDAVAKIGSKVQGLVFIEPAFTGKAAETFYIYSGEFLTIGTPDKGNAVAMIEDYLEMRGALK